MLTTFFTFIIGFVGRFITTNVLKWVALKGFVFTIFTLVLPTVLLKLQTKILTDTMNYANSHLALSGNHSISLQLISLGGWLANTVHLPSCVSIFLSAVALRYTLNLISPRI